MPVITVQLGKVPLIESKRRLARGITDVVCDVLEVSRREVTVLIAEFERDSWAEGGELLADRSVRIDEGPRQDPEAFFRAAPLKAKPKKAAAKPRPRR